LFDQVVINETSAGSESSGGLLSKSEQVRYYGGVSLKLPLSEVANRRNKKQLIHVSKKQWKYEMEQLHNQLRKLVIEEYFQLQYLQESLKSFQSIYNTLEISYMKAEHEVSNGRMDINDFALLASTTGKARDDLNKAKNSFYAQFNKMGIITGIPLNNLK
ncbi:MAG: TolC family protein, partial [Bacteroidales bacterium]|nr:TolC family protein [Bacteroidales bacterium]